MNTPLSLLTKNCLRAANAATGMYQAFARSQATSIDELVVLLHLLTLGWYILAQQLRDVVAHRVYEEHDEDDWDQHPVSDRRVERELVHDSAVLERAWALLPPKRTHLLKAPLCSAPCATKPHPPPPRRQAPIPGLGGNPFLVGIGPIW